MKTIKFKLTLIAVFVVVFSNSVMAQLPPGFGDTTVDDTSSPAPISGLVALGVIVGAVIGFKRLKNN